MSRVIVCNSSERVLVWHQMSVDCDAKWYCLMPLTCKIRPTESGLLMTNISIKAIRAMLSRFYCICSTGRYWAESYIYTVQWPAESSYFLWKSLCNPHPLNAVWFNQRPFCWCLLSFLSRVILGPCCLPHLHMWVFFITSGLFRIVYGRQGALEPEPRSCEAGRLASSQSPIRVTLQTTLHPYPVYYIHIVNYSLCVTTASKVKKNQQGNLIQTWTLYFFESLMAVLAVLNLQDYSWFKPASPVECG